MNKLTWLLLSLSALTQNPVLASGNSQVLHSIAVAAWIWLVIVLWCASKMHAHPVLVLQLMMGGGVFFYLITKPSSGHAGMWENWNHVAVSATTLLACLWLARKK